METDESEIYMLRPEADADEGDDGWVNPEPAEDVVLEAVGATVDADPGEFDPLGEYVDTAKLAAVLDADADAERIEFTIEGHDVMVDADGNVDVELDG